MSTVEQLERRYRRLLAVLPGSYRRLRGEEMLSTLMDGAGTEQRWPRVAEAGSLVVLGLRARTGVLVPVRVRTSSAPVVRLVALWGALYMAFEAVSDVAHYRNALLVYRMAGPGTVFGLLNGVWGFYLYAVAVPALWLLVFAAMMAGYHPVARLLAPIAALPVVLSTVRWQFDPAGVATIAIIGVAVFASFGPAARPAAGRRWWVGTLVALGAIDWVLATHDFGHGFRVYQAASYIELAVAVAMVLFALVKGIRSPEWPAALAVLGAPFAADVLWSPRYVAVGTMLIVTFEAILVSTAGFGLLRNLMVARRTGGVEL